MDILNETRVENFVNKLRNFDENRHNKKQDTVLDEKGMVEPRIFEMILKELNPSNILELSAISNACKQVCESNNINWRGVKYKKLVATTTTKGADIICGDLNLIRIPYILLRGLYILPKGGIMAMLLPVNFMLSSDSRWELFQRHPFNYCYAFNSSMRIYKDNRTFGVCRDYCWFAWENGNNNPPIVKTIDNTELNNKYMRLDNDRSYAHLGYRYKEKVNIHQLIL